MTPACGCPRRHQSCHGSGTHAYHPTRAHFSPNTAHFCAPHLMQRSSGGGEGHGVKDGAARAAPGAGEFRGAAQARGEPQARVAVRRSQGRLRLQNHGGAREFGMRADQDAMYVYVFWHTMRGPQRGRSESDAPGVVRTREDPNTRREEEGWGNGSWLRGGVGCGVTEGCAVVCGGGVG